MLSPCWRSDYNCVRFVTFTGMGEGGGLIYGEWQNNGVVNKRTCFISTNWKKIL